MEIIISNSNGIPIYEQIKNQLKNKILNNELKEGELLPSIRSLARDLKCSVITTKNAYEELEKEGFVITVPSKGIYVATINKDLVKERQLTKIEELLKEVLILAKTCDIKQKDIIEILEILSKEDIND